jgi:Chaperone of endosialidase
MKRMFFLFLFVSLEMLGQSVLITPTNQGINSNDTPRDAFEVRGNGILVQNDFTISTHDPNLNTTTIRCLSNPPYLTTESGVLKYPNAGTYSANIYCYEAISITSPPPNFVGYKVTFEMLDTEANGDSVIINSSYKYSGNSLPEVIYLPYNYVSVLFKSDNDANVGAGFRLKWQAVFRIPSASNIVDNFLLEGLFYDTKIASLRVGYFDKTGFSHPTFDGLGLSKIGYRSFGFGDNVVASGINSMAVGFNTVAKANNGFVVGVGNDITDNSQSFFTDRIFQIGNGSPFNFRSNAMTVLGSGNIGLQNNNSPIYPLSFGNFSGNKILLQALTNTTHFGIGLGSTTLQLFTPTTNHDIVFGIGSNSDFAENLRIKGNGKVGFGNSTTNLNSDERVEINGRLRIRDSTSTAGVWFNNSANSINSADGAFYGMKLNSETGIWIGNAWRFWVNNAGNGTFTGTVTATGFPIASDFRYKKNIQPLENTLSKVQKIVGVSYDLRKDEFPEKNFSDKTQIGFIAQDLEKIFPEMVFTDEKGYKSVDYARLTPVLVEALKELILKNQTLENKNQTLETKNQTLESRLDKIEAMLSTIQPNIESLNSKK